MRAQEIYSKVRQHLLTQNAKSVHGMMNKCAYRGTDGRSCAVGCLIPDELYRTSLEGGTVDRADVARLLKGLGITHENLDLVADLQWCHDQYLPSQWEEELCRIACKYRLEPE